MAKTRHLLTLLKADPADVELRQKVIDVTAVLDEFNDANLGPSGEYVSGFHFMNDAQRAAQRRGEQAKASKARRAKR